MTALLVVLSVAGAFVGSQRARVMFASPLLIVFWFLFLGLLIVGLFLFKRLVRSPGLLAVHLGTLLILAGSMYSSDGGHAVAAKLLGTRKIPFGYMRIHEGHVDSSVYRDGQKLGNLPFGVGLADFWIEHYEEPGPWLLGIDAPPDDNCTDRHREVIDWVEGEWVDVPFIGDNIISARLKVLQYMEGSRPVYAEGDAPVLQVTEDGKKTTVPANVGQEVSLNTPEGVMTLRIVEVFTHLQVRHGKAVNVAGSNANPALKIEIEQPDGTKSHRYAYAGRFQVLGSKQDELRYVLPRVVGAEPDPGTNLPAMEVLLSYKDRQLQEWLVARGPERPVDLSLAPLLDSQTPEGKDHGSAYLRMAKRRGPIRDYKSRLVALEEGQQVATKDIEVNDPLHYGGYHFYQYDYDHERGQFTILSVRSDSGLWPVWAGFFLLCAGMFWLFWLQPAGTYLVRR
jgi:hypothetical protein